jgi:sigma-B regulation protein RsbU (phosphoserine phosphatase)
MFVLANHTFCEWVGRSSDELIGVCRFQDLLTMGGRIFHHTHWHPLLQMQGSISEVKLDLLHRDGSVIPMVLNARRREHSGAVFHDLAAYVARDRDKYERELILSRKRLELLVAEATRHQEEAKDRALFAEQMVGIVSHDLRNPLSAVAMATALLARSDLTASQQRTLTRISRSTDRANRLIADLLDFTQARLGSGLTVSRDDVDLHAVTSEAVDELSHVYTGRVLRHERVGDGACSADANRLAQLTGNLVSNAMTYGNPSRPVIVTSAVDERSFTLAVHNEGTPIPEEIRARIFDPMRRGANVVAARRSVGLGLFIVREIARAHGGRAEVQSTAEEGTTFRVVCPRA